MQAGVLFVKVIDGVYFREDVDCEVYCCIC
jgi:hypothetical protein